MTKKDVITRMTNHGAVDIKEATAPFPKDYNGNEMHDIYYKRPLGENSKTKPATIRLIKEGADDFLYENGMPSWLKDAPTVTPARDFILPESTVISKIEAHYTAENNGSWNGEVFEDSIEMRRINSRDQIFVDIVNHSKAVEKRKEFIVSQVTAPDWVQPTGAHDAYDEIGELVTHNGKVWENTHGAGNSWEPGGTDIADTIWKEVDAVRIRPVQ